MANSKEFALSDKGFSDLSPVDFGYEICAPSKSFGPYVRNYYLIHYAVSGEGRFINQNGVHNVQKGSAFLIRPHEECLYIADKNNPWVYIWIGFSGKLAKAFDTAPDVFEADGSLFEEMRSVASGNIMIEENLTGLLFKLYATLFAPKEKNDLVSKVIGYINARYMYSISINEIASFLGVNRKYLARIFKERTGSTMQKHLIKKRMTEAKKLLKSGHRVEETAFMVGYGDSFTFSKAFKKYCGFSPQYFK